MASYTNLRNLIDSCLWYFSRGVSTGILGIPAIKEKIGPCRREGHYWKVLEEIGLRQCAICYRLKDYDLTDNALLLYTDNIN